MYLRRMEGRDSAVGKDGVRVNEAAQNTKLTGKVEVRGLHEASSRTKFAARPRHS
jgi:hypothetical protein